MSVNSVQIDKGIMTVDGKTGQRTIPISPMCLPVLSQYMDTMKDAEPTDPLWLAQGTWINKKVGIDYSSVRKMLKEAAKRAGIKKRIYPHLFRHTRASIYYGSNKLSSVQLRMFMGWSKRSNVGETTYAHLTPENLIEAVNNADGKTTNKPKENPVDKVCAICGTANPLTSTLCSNPKCGNNLDKPVLNYNKNVEDFKELVVESLKDPKLFEEVMHNYLVQQRKKKLR